MKNVLGQKKGSTLIEVLIAMVILALVVAPFLSMFMQAARANAESRVMMDASYYGQNLMEEVKYSLGESPMADAKGYLSAQGYTEEMITEDDQYTYTKTEGDFTYEVDLDEEHPFLKITVKVFTDVDKTKCKANIQVLCQ